jgi:predicted RNA-binding protein YlqC (UPF0109 family)
MEKLVHRIVEALVDHPEQIAINEIQGAKRQYWKWSLQKRT